MKRSLLAGFLALFLAACTTEGTPSGAVVLSVEGLEPGLSGEVLFSGPVKKTFNQAGVLSLPLGTYTVEARPVSNAQGIRYVATEVTSPVEVKRTGQSIVKVRYALDVSTRPAVLALLIQGLPDGAQAEVLVGERVVTASSVLSLPPGIYLVRARPVEFDGRRYVASPGEEFINLGPGENKSLTIRYSASANREGVLAVSIQFSPGIPGSEGYVVLTGLGVNQVVRTSQVLVLPEGVYTLTAYSVNIEGTTYAPTPAGATVELSANTNRSVVFMYAPR